jgi:hypothetical protein
MEAAGIPGKSSTVQAFGVAAAISAEGDAEGLEPRQTPGTKKMKLREKQIGLHKQGGNTTLDSIMKKAFWPVAVVAGFLLFVGMMGGFNAPTAQAGIQMDDTVDGAPLVWWISTEFGLEDDCDSEGNLVAELADATNVLDEDDTIWLPVDGSVWICVELDEEGDPGGDADYDEVQFDSDDYGTWEEALCADEDDDDDFDEDDFCEDTSILGTDQLNILCNTPDLDSECQSEGADGDVAVLFVCDDDPGQANVTVAHDIDGEEGDSPDLVNFTIICFDEPDSVTITAVPDRVQIVPSLGDVQYALVYIEAFDGDEEAAIPGSEVTWTTDNCEIAESELVDVDLGDGDFIDEDEAFNDVILEVFEEFDDNATPETADDINNLVDALDFGGDWDDTFDSLTWDANPDFDSTETISAVILNCGDGHEAEAGVAEVCAIIEVEDDSDIRECVEVTVVGPPAAPLVIAADPAGPVRCGERVTITVTVKDAEGQPVSDHTLVEAVTNFGGVLGGTGAVAGFFGLVTPVSSTVAETFNGVATFSLITSETHSGPYVVLVTTGGGGSVAPGGFGEGNDEDEDFDEFDDNGGLGDDDFINDEDDNTATLGGLFSTAVVTGQVTVACTIPAAAAPQAPAPTVRAPSTGQGITPPSTGDAGLADASGNSLALFAIAGVVVVLAGAASVKFARR